MLLVIETFNFQNFAINDTLFRVSTTLISGNQFSLHDLKLLLTFLIFISIKLNYKSYYYSSYFVKIMYYPVTTTHAIATIPVVPVIASTVPTMISTTVTPVLLVSMVV